MTKLATPLCTLLGTRLPIIQAPMAGGITTPALVAAASKAGALGSFGFAYTQPEAMARDVEAVRALTDAPINLNFFVNAQPAPVAADATGRCDQCRGRLLRRAGAARAGTGARGLTRRTSMRSCRWRKT